MVVQLLSTLFSTLHNTSARLFVRWNVQYHWFPLFLHLIQCLLYWELLPSNLATVMASTWSGSPISRHLENWEKMGRICIPTLESCEGTEKIECHYLPLIPAVPSPMPVSHAGITQSLYQWNIRLELLNLMLDFLRNIQTPRNISTIDSRKEFSQ